jgi:anthranilate synthase component 1
MNPTKKRIKVRTHERIYPRNNEAFDVFRNIHSQIGATHAFLLDSVTDLNSKYGSSVIGLFPLLACRSKGNSFLIDGHPVLTQLVTENLREKGFHEQLVNDRLPAILDVIRESFDMNGSELVNPYSFGFMGYFAYDAIRYFENIPNTTLDDRQLDDVLLQVHQAVLHFEADRIRVVINEVEGVETPGYEVIESFLNSSPSAEFAGFEASQLRVEEDVAKDEFIARVLKAKEYIREGDIFQIVLSKRDRIIGIIDPLLIYKRLKEVNPSPYMFYVDYGDLILFGASPEMQIRLENGVAQMRPIAGTTKGKGLTKEENQQLVDNLLEDEKERAEHLMLVDLCRNDLGRVCQPGSIHVKNFMAVEEYSHVFHIVSTVEGKIEADRLPFEIFLSTFPAGTLSGAPKIRAMEIIDELETLSRGPYGGVIGFFDFLGNMNTAIVIRTVIYQDGISYLQAGAGIVADSIPENEWNECNHKLKVLETTIFAQ